MKKFITEILLPVLAFIGFLLLITVCGVIEAEGQAYIVTFNKIRSVAVSNPSELSTALSSAVAGDEIVLADGTYSGSFIASRAGTNSNAIVIKAASHAILNGTIKVTGAHTYIYGLEVTGGGSVPGIELQCSNCGAINNVVHAMNGVVGIFAYNAGANQVVYGNIIYDQISTGNNPHNIYTQNNYGLYGYKYFVGNLLLDAESVTASTYNFHAYAEGNFVSGIWLERNISANGKFLTGSISSQEADHHIIYRNNYFWRSSPQVGYRRPIQYEATDNYFGRSGFDVQYQSGEGENCYVNQLSEPSLFKRNKILFPSGPMYKFRTSIYTSCGVRVDGTATIRPVDEWDNNALFGAFLATFNAGGVNAVSLTKLSDWQMRTRVNGLKEFDTNSTISVVPPSTEYFIIQNEYDPSLAFLVVYNWSGWSSLPISRSGSYSLYDPKDSWGTPIAVSDTNGNATVPLSGEFTVLLIRGTTTPPDPDPVCDMKLIEQLASDIMAIRLDGSLSFQQRVRRMGRKDLELIEAVELCEN